MSKKNTFRINKNNLPKIIFWIYICTLLLITVFRPWNGPWHFLKGNINCALFTEYRHIRSFFLFIYLFFGNIVWFIPQGFYLTFFKKTPLYKGVLSGFLLSLCIEIAQFILGTGVSEIDDLILNTFGTFVGCLIAMLVIKLMSRRR